LRRLILVDSSAAIPPIAAVVGGWWRRSRWADFVAKVGRKLQGPEFFAKIRNGKRSLIRITSIALPKSPVSLT
jgi:hypothetical protein